MKGQILPALLLVTLFSFAQPINHSMSFDEAERLLTASGRSSVLLRHPVEKREILFEAVGHSGPFPVPNFPKANVYTNYQPVTGSGMFSSPVYSSAGQVHQSEHLGTILLDYLFWGSLSGLLLGTAAGLQINDDLPGDAKTSNVLLFSAFGGGIGFTTGLVVGFSKIAKRKKANDF